MLDETQVAAHHEAGHAVGAHLRGGGSITEQPIINRDGTGLTRIRIKSFDHAFVAYAGIWAGARYGHDWCARHNHLDCGGQELCLDDYVVAEWLGQCGGATTEAHLSDSDILAQTPREALAAQMPVWDEELERVWSVTQWVAHCIVNGTAMTGESMDQRIDAVLIL